MIMTRCENVECANGQGDCMCTTQVDVKLNNVVQMVLYNEGKGGAPHEGIPHPVHIHGRHFFVVKQGWGTYHPTGLLATQNQDVRCNETVECFNSTWTNK